METIRTNEFGTKEWWYEIACEIGYDDFSPDEVVELLLDPTEDSDDPGWHVFLWSEIFHEALKRILAKQFGIDALVWFFIVRDEEGWVYWVHFIVIDKATARVLSVLDQNSNVPKTPDDVYRIAFTFQFPRAFSELDALNKELMGIAEKLAEASLVVNNFG